MAVWQARVRRLGQVDYQATYAKMRTFTEMRTPATLDEFWLLQHPPVYTTGLRIRPPLPRPRNDIPVVATDRGGDVTYHGPGQPVIYVLLDLPRRGLGIRELVQQLEQSVIDFLTELDIAASRREGAPGVYVGGKKIASLGLRVRGGGSYHGLSFNAAMDLAPFRAIDPCGYPGLEVTDLASLRPEITAKAAGERLLGRVLEVLSYTAAHD
jgi:lipoyl(octanoyl) transferase